jgi:hypothetical protein
MFGIARARNRCRWLLIAVTSGFIVAGAAAADAMASSGAVYTQTNAESGNAVQKFDRAGDGSLTPAGTYPTGGNGLSRTRRPDSRALRSRSRHADGPG